MINSLPSGILACAIGLTLFAPDSRAAVDFARDIAPILEQRCIECHGPEKQKGKLRLDSKAGAFKEDYVIIGIYNLNGQLVNQLFSGVMSAGPQKLDWNGDTKEGNTLENGI